jgi:hypothetical protein
VRDNHGNIFKWYGANTDIENRKRAEALLAAEKQTLEMIANGACLPDILEKLCETIDAQSSDVKSAVMLMDPDGIHLRPAAGPRFPKEWLEAITPVKIGPCVAFRTDPSRVSFVPGSAGSIDPVRVRLDSRPCWLGRLCDTC